MILSSKKGFSLISLMLSLALLSVIGLMAAQTYSQIRNSNSQSFIHREVESKISQISKHLISQRICSFNFKGLELPEIGETIEIDNIKLPFFDKDQNLKSERVIIQKFARGDSNQEFVTRNYHIKSMLIESLGQSSYKLILSLKRNEFAEPGVDEIKKIIPLSFSIDENNIVQDCYGNLTEKSKLAISSTCTELGGTFNQKDFECLLPQYELGDCDSNEFFAGFELDQSTATFKKICLEAKFNNDADCNNDLGFGVRFDTGSLARVPGFRCRVINNQEFADSFSQNKVSCHGYGVLAGATSYGNKVVPTCR